MVRIKKDDKAIPFPRRLTRTELERFWMKLMEDVAECWEVMPNVTTFNEYFGNLTYDSFSEAQKYYREFKNKICRGEEPTIPEKFLKPTPLGETIADEILIVTGRLYSNEQFLKQKGYVISEEDRFSIDNIINEVNKVRGIQPNIEQIKEVLKKGWIINEKKRKGIALSKGESEFSSCTYMLTGIPKESLEMIIGEKLPDI